MHSPAFTFTCLHSLAFACNLTLAQVELSVSNQQCHSCMYVCVCVLLQALKQSKTSTRYMDRVKLYGENFIQTISGLILAHMHESLLFARVSLSVSINPHALPHLRQITCHGTSRHHRAGCLA